MVTGHDSREDCRRESAAGLAGRAIFLSSSIPDPRRWRGVFDPREITDAVVALAREVLHSGGDLVTAAHPTIAPLILYVARELVGQGTRPHVSVYQSRLYEDVLPEATQQFVDEGIGSVHWTEAVNGEEPEHGKSSQSLLGMRQRMLEESNPAAALFIGGMGGIVDEHRLFRECYPDRMTYALGRPGGEAARLVDTSPRELSEALALGDVYPAVARRVVAHIVRWLGDRPSVEEPRADIRPEGC